MTNDFENLSFSIFKNISYEQLTAFLADDYREDIESGQMILSNGILPLGLYKTPEYNPNPEIFSFWRDTFHDCTFFMGNQLDGFISTVNRFYKHLRCDCFFISMSNANVHSYLGYSFYAYMSDGMRREIQAIQGDTNWEFWQDGNPLPFEDINFYKDRLIKKRINNDIIKLYLSRLGIEFKDIGENVVECLTCKRYWSKSYDIKGAGGRFS